MGGCWVRKLGCAVASVHCEVVRGPISKKKSRAGRGDANEEFLCRKSVKFEVECAYRGVERSSR